MSVGLKLAGDVVPQGVKVTDGVLLGDKVVPCGIPQGDKTVPYGSPQGAKVGVGEPLGVMVGLPSIALLAVYSLLVSGTYLSKNFLHSCCRWIKRFGMVDNSDGSKCTLNLPNLFFAG